MLVSKLNCRFNNSVLLNFISKSSALNLIRRNSNDSQEPEAEKSKAKTIRKKKGAKNVSFQTNINNEQKTKAMKDLKRILVSVNQTSSVETDVEKNIDMVKAVKKEKNKNSYIKKLLDSIDNVAVELGGDVGKTKKDLKETFKVLNILKGVSSNKKSENSETAKIKSILSDINNISKKEKKLTAMNSESIAQSYYTMEPQVAPLNIFIKHQPDKPNTTQLQFWDKLEEAELKLMVLSSPKNYFEEMILWTKQGKLWHFPIDNDQGLNEEAEVNFTEHVFLEDHLEPWCPKEGPIRHFMELVLTGLSKNPHLKVEDKVEHIKWYQDYFDKKRKILMEVGVLAQKTIQPK